MTSPYRSDSWNIRNMPAHAWPLAITSALCLRFSSSFPSEHIQQNRNGSKSEVYLLIMRWWVDSNNKCALCILAARTVIKEIKVKNIRLFFDIYYLYMTHLIYQKWMIVVACLLNVTDLTYLFILHLTVQRGFYVFMSWICQPTSSCMVWTELNTEIHRFTLHRSHYKFTTRTLVRCDTVSCYHGYDD